MLQEIIKYKFTEKLQQKNNNTLLYKKYIQFRQDNYIFAKLISYINIKLLKIELFLYKNYTKLPFAIYFTLNTLRVWPTFVYLKDNILLAPYSPMIGGVGIVDVRIRCC